MHSGFFRSSSIGMALIAAIAATPAALAEEKAPPPASPAANVGLKELNERISNLSLEIMKQQKDLAQEVEKLLAQRQSMLTMEKKLTATLTEQESKLFSQRLAIEDAERLLAREKNAYQDQNKRLDELRASLKSSREMSANLATDASADRK